MPPSKGFCISPSKGFSGCLNSLWDETSINPRSRIQGSLKTASAAIRSLVSRARKMIVRANTASYLTTAA
ncbi:hypothetical protein [Kingella oralis]|uniref:hypothetical protein n=1 Tax=Kingella oralis TaxID=505 RepID=UPI0034E3955A